MGPQHSEVPAKLEDQICKNRINKEVVEIYVLKITKRLLGMIGCGCGFEGSFFKCLLLIVTLFSVH